MTAVKVTEQLDAMQRVLFPNSQLSETLQKNACSFWDTQDQILDATQAFADGWFERRHAGTHAALEAAQRICKAETPIEMVREYQKWASGAFQRLTADGMACQQQCMAVVTSIAAPLSSPTSRQQAESLSTEWRSTVHDNAA
jgi:hypothetical protein